MTSLSEYHTYVIAAAGLPVLYAALRDLREFRIPNECALLLLALYPLHVWLSPEAVDIAGGVVTGGIVFAAAFSLYLLNKFGGGDVKMLAALALWAGPSLVGDLVMVTTLSGGVLALVFLSRARVVLALALDHAGDVGARDNVLAERLPYGVAIAIGGIAVLFQLIA